MKSNKSKNLLPDFTNCEIEEPQLPPVTLEKQISTRSQSKIKEKLLKEELENKQQVKKLHLCY